MAHSLSKIDQVRDVVLKGCDCHHVFHPWTKNCRLAVLDMIWCACRGTYKYFLVIYLLQLFLRGRQVNGDYLKSHAKGFLQSALFGSLMSGSFIAASCGLRSLLGRYYHYTAVGLPGLISAANIFWERPIRRNLYMFTFSQVTLEYLVRVLEQSHIGPLSKALETVIFMICNGLLLYLIRSTKNMQSTLYWFFKPPNVHVDDGGGIDKKVCPHEEDCWKYIFKSVVQYAGAGVGIQLLKTLITKMHLLVDAPIKTVHSVLENKNTFTLGIFLGAYIGIYKSISCLLCHRFHGDSDLYALPAGILAGSAYWVHPERTFALSALTTILQLTLKWAFINGIIPNVPFSNEVIFVLCCGILFQARFIDAQICPRFFATTLATITRGRSDYIYRMFEKRAEDVLQSMSTDAVALI